jgi:hypothetical protein
LRTDSSVKPFRAAIYAGDTVNEIVEFLQGNETAEQALKDVEAAYMTKAKDGNALA